ncbi:MAG: 30S ribosomal protein S21 [Bacteroidia bacterium]|nr:30S ribosomal protein S21 [Bacteroidia bacterium]
MLRVKIHDGESIDRALKRFKKKFEKTGVLREIRERQAYTKPSRRKREQHLKAVYKQQLLQEEL